MYGNRNFGGQRGGGFSPVKVGEEVDVKVEAVGEKGDGIAKVKGFVLFVPGAKEGDEIKIKVTKVLRNVGFAESIGAADGPIESEEAQNTQEESPAEETSEVAATEAPADDSEDFGEESADDSEDFGEEEPKAEDAPVEEEAAPVEEAAPEEDSAEEEKKED